MSAQTIAARSFGPTHFGSMHTIECVNKSWSVTYAVKRPFLGTPVERSLKNKFASVTSTGASNGSRVRTHCDPPVVSIAHALLRVDHFALGYSPFDPEVLPKRIGRSIKERMWLPRIGSVVPACHAGRCLS